LNVGASTLPGGMLRRQHPPLASTQDKIQDRIDDRSHLQRARSASWLCSRNQFFDTIPLTVGQIGWIQLVLFRTPSVPPRSSGCHPFSNSFLARLCTILLSNKQREQAEKESNWGLKPHQDQWVMWEKRNCPTDAASRLP